MILSGNDDSEVTRGAGYFVQWRAVAVEEVFINRSMCVRGGAVGSRNPKKRPRHDGATYSVFFPKKYIPEKEL